MARCLLRLPSGEVDVVVVEEQHTKRDFINNLKQQHYELLDIPYLQLYREQDGQKIDIDDDDLVLPYFFDDCVYYVAAEQVCSVTFNAVTCPLAFSDDDSATAIRSKLVLLFGSHLDCRADDLCLTQNGIEVQLPQALESGASYGLLARQRLPSASVTLHWRSDAWKQISIPATGEPQQAFKTMRAAVAHEFGIPNSVHIEFCRRDESHPTKTHPVSIAEVLYEPQPIYISLQGYTIVKLQINSHSGCFMAIPPVLTTLRHVQKTLVELLGLDCEVHDIELYSTKFEAVLCKSAVIEQDDLLTVRVAELSLEHVVVSEDQLLVVQEAPSTDYSSTPTHSAGMDEYGAHAVRQILACIRAASPTFAYGTVGEVLSSGLRGVVVPNFQGEDITQMEEIPGVVFLLVDEETAPIPCSAADFEADFARNGATGRITPGAVVQNTSSNGVIGVAVMRLPRSREQWLVRWTMADGSDPYDIVKESQVRLLQL